MRLCVAGAYGAYGLKRPDALAKRWSRNFGPIVKMDRMTREVIQDEETKEPFA
jgi:hypothetical protein